MLSLVIVPAFYLIMDDLSRLLGWLFKGIIGQKEAEPEVPDAATLAARLTALETSQDARLGLLAAAQTDLRDRLSDLEPKSAKGMAAE
jgi:hypothetical protein